MYPGENLLLNEYLESSEKCYRIDMGKGTSLSLTYTPADKVAKGYVMWNKDTPGLTPYEANFLQSRLSMNAVSLDAETNYPMQSKQVPKSAGSTL